MRGLLGPVSRKNGWQLAEYAGWRRPDGQQHLLDRAKWDVDELRDRVRRYALDGLADSAGGVLVIDETGFAKKGETSVGVARQFTGSLGGVFPCQIGVFAAWATTRGATLVDREIYLPQVWTGDRERCAAAQVPETVGFATKPRLAEKMIDRILPELPENTWLAADEVYGRDGGFRSFAESRQLPYVVNVSSAQTVLPRPGWRRIDKLAAAADDSEWQLIEASPSQTGSRWWQWWVRRIADPQEPVGSAVRGQPWPSRWMIARRRPETPDDLDYYLAWGPSGTPPEHLAHVAARAGGWKTRSNSASISAGWPTTRCATGTAGTGTSPCRCWRPHSWRYRPPQVTPTLPHRSGKPSAVTSLMRSPKGGARGHHQPRTAHPLHRGRDPQAPYAHPPATPTRTRSDRPRTVVVTLATTSPGRRQRAPSQTPGSRTRPELQLKG
ncbi:IS701 family transposase [Streptomyces kaempferi]